MNADAFILRRAVFGTFEFAQATGVSMASASRHLMRRAHAGPLTRVVRAVWANPQHPHFTRLGVVPHLLRNEQGYVSFLTALQRHGVISQLPHAVFVATTGHARALETPIGAFRFIQLKPNLMELGVAWVGGEAPYAMATAEKALLDCLYVATRRGRAFGHLPEIELGSISRRRFAGLLTKHRLPGPIDVAVRRRAEDLLHRR